MALLLKRTRFTLFCLLSTVATELKGPLWAVTATAEGGGQVHYALEQQFSAP